MKSKRQENKLMKMIRMPIRALAKARDFYVKSMNNYADKACYGGASTYADPLPRSFSTSSSIRSSNTSDDYKELVRAASTSTLGNRINLSSSSVLNNHANTSTKKEFKGVPRSASVGMAKIEEDKPIDFDVNNNNNNNNNNDAGVNIVKHKFGIFPRSRSYAVAATKRSSPAF
ncbi:uncharacterized protein [Spinacia oleracea]|uniref:DUF4005 domain-containing protein n=1 Tax=Spinacia oleracea TaxID=3562 RepID=A0A9R0J2N3_SPIOL|nr:uncharacterized protein LOC110798974 [Spinacia oleracea]